MWSLWTLITRLPEQSGQISPVKALRPSVGKLSGRPSMRRSFPTGRTLVPIGPLRGVAGKGHAIADAQPATSSLQGNTCAPIRTYDPLVPGRSEPITSATAVATSANLPDL